MFVFRKENHTSICTCSWTFLVLRVTLRVLRVRNQRRGRDEKPLTFGVLDYSESPRLSLRIRL